MKKIRLGKGFHFLLVMLAIYLTSLACTLPINLGSSNKSTVGAQATVQPTNIENPQQLQSTNSPTNTPSNNTDPLDHLLDLHSVQFTFTILRIDGSSRSINAQIDSVGNMHVTIGYSGYTLGQLPENYDIKSMPASSDVYVIDGKMYIPSKQDPNWMNNPIQQDFKQYLSTWLHGSEGPALWLEILPTGSITKAGNETVGGFAAVKYLVNGSVANQVISGTLWEDPQTDALVQADLHIPGPFLSTPDKPQSGELKISLTAQKINIPPISLPAGINQETSTP